MAMPKITCARWPLPAGERPLRRASGETWPTGKGVALCRCGSQNKPFCDGTHSRNGFRDENRADPAKDKREAYAGRASRSSTTARCALPRIAPSSWRRFSAYGKEPWIDPDGASVKEIIAVIRKCPSGALSYAIGGVEAAPPARPPMVTVIPNGPTRSPVESRSWT